MKDNNEQIIEFFAKLVNDEGVLEIPEEVFVKMDKEYGELLRLEFPYALMFKLPQYEIDFFKWLKSNDPLVWNELWKGQDDKYVVSLQFFATSAGT